MVAVKVPRSGTFSTDADEARFVGEARKVAHLSHRGIVPVHEIGRGDEFPFIVTEFVEGSTLADARTFRKFTAREAAELVAEVDSYLLRAIGVFETLQEQDTEDLRYQEALATAHNVRGALFEKLGEFDEARRAVEMP